MSTMDCANVAFHDLHVRDVTSAALVHTGFQENQEQNSGGARYGWKMMGNKRALLLAKTL